MVTLVAGGLSGALAKTAVAPLARLTILYQVRCAQSRTSLYSALLARTHLYALLQRSSHC